MKKLLSLLIIFALVTTFFACSDDEPANLDAPSITAPTAADVQVGTTATLDFAYTAAAGFASSTATATGGTVTVDTDGTDGATSGTISVTFTAGASAAAGSVTLTVTDKEGDSNNVTSVFAVRTEVVIPNVVLSGVLTGAEDGTADNTINLTNDRIYELAGRVVVPDGKILDIQEGTIVKGREGSGSLASALIIARGGKIMAEGTSTKPIIFTSILDNIKVGELAGTNLDAVEDTGLWGGVLVLGKATVAVPTGEAQIEGVPADIDDAKYGGGVSPVDNDNSGTLRYISIRHGGTLIGANNEINGLTLGGVGSGTTIEFIEVVGNEDDGIEWFGGSVNVTNALVWAQKDDGFDIDQAYKGTIDNIIYIAGPESDHGMEIDGPESSVNGGFTIQNGSFKGLVGEYADFRDKAQGTVKDLYFFNYLKSSDLELDADGTDASASTKNSDNPGVSDNFAGAGAGFTGALVITGLEFNSTVTDDAGAQTLGAIFADKWSKSPNTYTLGVDT
ncbi:MAG: hypothetical protein RIF39_04890, partial [Cyclobacteriaceae bacterium]